MGINWVTFIAQIVNLFVLIWLLKRFLYRPILEAVEKRQAEIAKKVRQAHQEYEAAQNEHQSLINQKVAFQKEKEALFNQAATQIDKLKQEQKEELTKLKEKTIQKMYAQMRVEKESIETQIRDLTVENFMKLSKKMMNDFGILTPMDNAVILFQKALNKLSLKEKKEIGGSILKQKEITILCTPAPSEEQRKAIQNALSNAFSLPSTIQYVFKEENALIIGIEIKIADLLVSWNLKSYLDEMQENINKALSEKLNS